VNYGNSVLGMHINRMATGFEVLCAIAGRIPVFGLLTDEGRKAKWHIDVRLSKEPHWGALGGAVGTKVVEQVPYVTGVDQWLTLKEDDSGVAESVRFRDRVEWRRWSLSRGKHYARSPGKWTWPAG
jgi:predicted aconitase